jgi:hypothetical protein
MAPWLSTKDIRLWARRGRCRSWASTTSSPGYPRIQSKLSKSSRCVLALQSEQLAVFHQRRGLEQESARIVTETRRHRRRAHAHPMSETSRSRIARLLRSNPQVKQHGWVDCHRLAHTGGEPLKEWEGAAIGADWSWWEHELTAAAVPVQMRLRGEKGDERAWEKRQHAQLPAIDTVRATGHTCGGQVQYTFSIFFFQNRIWLSLLMDVLAC